MDIFALLILAKYLAGKASPPDMPTYYATFANSGSEVAGIVRSAFYFAEPDVVSDTEIDLANETPISLDTPDGTADEIWVYDSLSGGNRWFKEPIAGGPITLVDGGNKTFPPGDFTHTLEIA
ncbi:hypothetical protein [Intrasporangium flavum]|uniref:hypothetical protein n=1 Tax=Intrasporangium flavum TaxID=1428657 RepID=UPI00096E1C3C|nr:hypothetical protein [Intrasporangium flavum]